jgi:hypothetical protein
MSLLLSVDLDKLSNQQLIDLTQQTLMILDDRLKSNVKKRRAPTDHIPCSKFMIVRKKPTNENVLDQQLDKELEELEEYFSKDPRKLPHSNQHAK